MAKQSAKQSEVPAETPAPKKSGGKKGLLIIVAVVGVMLAIIGGGGAWFFLGHKSEPHAAQAKPGSPPLFVTLEPFVVNLAGDVQHYLQVGIDLRVVDNAVSDQIKLHLPEIRNAVLLLLSSKSVEDLAGVDQKNRLRDEIREVVNRPLGIHTPAQKPASAEAGAEAPAAAEPAPAPAASPAEKPADPVNPAEPAREAQMDSGVLEVLLTSFVIQ